jgi:hypothetical protein
LIGLFFTAFLASSGPEFLGYSISKMVDGGEANWKGSGCSQTKLKEKLKQAKDNRVGRGPDRCVHSRQVPCRQFAASSSGSQATENPEIVSDVLPITSVEQVVEFDLDYGLRQPFCVTDLDFLEEFPDLIAGDLRVERNIGVRYRNGSFTAEIRVTKRSKRIWLGSFKTAEAAALAHDVATFLRATYFGAKDPTYNFDSSPSSFPPFDEISHLNSDEEKFELIRKLAKKFAREERGH